MSIDSSTICYATVYSACSRGSLCHEMVVCQNESLWCVQIDVRGFMKSGGANCDFYYATAGHRVKRAAREPRSPGGSLWYSITRSSGRAGPSTRLKIYALCGPHRTCVRGPPVTPRRVRWPSGRVGAPHAARRHATCRRLSDSVDVREWVRITARSGSAETCASLIHLTVTWRSLVARAAHLGAHRKLPARLPLLRPPR